MVRFALPEDMAAWCEEQVAVGRAASVGLYVARLVAQDMRQHQRQQELRIAIADGRNSGISMQNTDVTLSFSTENKLDPRIEAARAAVRQGRLSGTSLASIDGILTRATLLAGAGPRAHAA